MKNIEIERKFLLDKNLNFAWKAKYIIGYLSINDLNETRVYKKVVGDKVEKCVLTIKGVGDLSRIEIEREIENDEFELLYGICKYRAEKHSTNIDGIRVSLAINQFGDKLWSAEKEFENEDEALKYKSPLFCIRDITFDKRYKMRNWVCGFEE